MGTYGTFLADLPIDIAIRVKGDTAVSFFGGVKNCTDLNFSLFFVKRV
jgi:hypothetical protein